MMSPFAGMRCWQDKTLHDQTVAMSQRQCDQFLGKLCPEKLPDSIHRPRHRCQIEYLTLIPAQAKAHPRSSQRMQSHLMLHMCRLGRFRPHELAPRRHIEKQRLRLNHGAWCAARLPHIPQLPTFHQDFRACNRSRLPRHHPKSRHTRDARHRLPTKSQCPDRRQIPGIAQLASRMPF